MIMSLHVTHLSAGLEGLEGSISRLRELVEEGLALDGVCEHVVLSTCNRFEVYVASDGTGTAERSLESLVRDRVPYSRTGASSFILEGRESIQHLFKVVCGLDSLMIGEDQIQHQVKEAYLEALDRGDAGPRMGGLFEKALSVGKRVRTETSLNNGAVSVGSAAVQLAEEHMGTLEGKVVTVVGAGEMATLVAKSLRGRGPRAVFVSNRTYENAKELAYQLDGVAVGMDSLTHVLGRSDIVLVATAAPHVILSRATVEKAMEGRAAGLLVIDVSMPSNVDPGVKDVGGVELCLMDGLKEIALTNIERRRKEMADAGGIVCEELDRYQRERDETEADKVISVLNQKVSCIREREMDRACRRRAANGNEEVIEDLSRALVSKIMAAPFSRLKEACRNGDMELCRAAEYLFDLEGD